MRKWLLVLFASLISVLPCHAQQQVGIPSNQIAPVFQHQSEWCWAASLQLVENYYGLSTTQEQIVLRAHGNLYNLPASDGDIINALHWDLGSEWTEYPGSLLKLVLYQNLEARRPVLVAFRTGFESAHVVVITGAYFGPEGSLQAIVYRDPFPIPFNLQNGGRVELEGLALYQFLSNIELVWVD